MIELHTWTTPNGRKPIVMLEELGLDYQIRPVNIGTGDQHKPGYKMLNPNEKIPTIVDSDGPEGAPITVFESGAILIYLADKTGRFLPARGGARYAALQWLMFQMAAVGPMLGQAHHFLNAEQDHPHAEERFLKEAARIYRVLDGHLGAGDFLAGDYSIADMATFPWVRDPSALELDLATYPNLARWIERLESREAVRRAMAMAMPESA